MCSWALIERVGRRRLMVGGRLMMTTMLPVIGGISILNTPTALKVTVALMTVWGFLVRLLSQKPHFNLPRLTTENLVAVPSDSGRMCIRYWR